MQVKVIGSFLTRTASRAIATTFEEEIIRLKDLRTQIEIIVEKQPLLVREGVGVGLLLRGGVGG